MILPCILSLGVFAGPSMARVVTARSQTCSNIPKPTVPGAAVLSITAEEKRNHTVPAAPKLGLLQEIPNIDVCEVIVTLAHAQANDTVKVQTWLPLQQWNNRFVAVGGSAWAAGLGEISLAPFVAQGFVVSTTDAGLSGDPSTPALWALNSDGTVNTELLTNFASRSVHDLAVVGKAVAASYYGRASAYAYWNGCSTGGRQGLVAAQKYPEHFNGILAASPASYWTEYVIAELWPQVVMKEAGYFPSPCELNAVVKAAISACDGLDKVKDGVLNDPSKCKPDLSALVGTKAQCEGTKEVTLGRQLVDIVQKIWDGPRNPDGSSLWYGLTVGAPLSFLSNTTEEGSSRVANPFFVADTWIRYFVTANPDFNTSSVDSTAFGQLFSESKQKFSDLIDSADPSLSKLQKSAGKLLVWHGLADQLIYPQDMTQYHHEVSKAMSGPEATDEFFRLFLAPGVDHCGLGTTPGAVPTNPFGALMSWVENGTAPEYLDAATVPSAPANFTRKVCHYPFEAKYDGCGDAASAASYTCTKP